MKLYIIISLLILYSLSYSQNIQTNYYKDLYGIKEVSEKKAKIKKVTTTNEDGTYIIEFFELSTGKLRKRESYTSNNVFNGVWVSYDENGKETSKKDYTKLKYSNEKIEGGNYSSNVEFQNKELDFTPARFSYNNDDATQYIAHNTNYPNIAKDYGVQGKVFIQIKINTDGEVEIVSIIKSVHPSLDLEVWELFEKMPKWIPATKDGTPIESYTIMPVNFKLY